MNLALESFSSGQSRQNMQNETLVVRERNDNAQNQLEVAFRERQQKENQNKEIEKKLNEVSTNICSYCYPSIKKENTNLIYCI